jgi:hypothetical protein
VKIILVEETNVPWSFLAEWGNTPIRPQARLIVALNKHGSDGPSLVPMFQNDVTGLLTQMRLDVAVWTTAHENRVVTLPFPSLEPQSLIEVLLKHPKRTKHCGETLVLIRARCKT